MYMKVKKDHIEMYLAHELQKIFKIVAEPPELFQLKCPSRTLKGSNTLKQE